MHITLVNCGLFLLLEGEVAPMRRSLQVVSLVAPVLNMVVVGVPLIQPLLRWVARGRSWPLSP